ncbi:Beta-galactosidase 5 [Pelomyxa schiedti]|nr:Beta-galactosidase 5 [Pelomyxa schiedti]
MGVSVVLLLVGGIISLSSGLEPGFITYGQVGGAPYTVTYDQRSLLINGVNSLFISGSVHYPRATPAMWDTLFDLAISNGLNMIDLYVFWDLHEPLEGQFYWEGNANLTHFVKLCGEHNLFVNLRIGPYVCAEWDYGGIPVWVGFKEGIKFRTSNDEWCSLMTLWFNRVVTMLRPLFATHGGPIVLVQVENELGSSAPSTYVEWCGTMANEALISTPVPIIMCNGESASTTINSCNGNDCTSFIEEHGQSGRILVDQPALWTENEGGFQVWGESPTRTTSYFWGRTAADLAYSTARWYARGGSLMNYYMWFGGNHFGRWAGSGLTNMYASDVNVCPDMLPHEPKFSHMQRMHVLLAEYSKVIVTTEAQLDTPVHLTWFNNKTQQFEEGTQQLAYVYGTTGNEFIFLENQADIYILSQFRGKNFTLPDYSVTFVDSNLNELYCTAKIGDSETHRTVSEVPISLSWMSWQEPLSTAAFPSVDNTSPSEQSSVTAGLTEYLFYSTNASIGLTGSHDLYWLGTRSNAYLVFVNGVFTEAVDNHAHDDGIFEFVVRIKMEDGTNEITILSETLGFDNGMSVGSTAKTKGIIGKVKIGLADDITDNTWNMRPYLAGQNLDLYTWEGLNQVTWSQDLLPNTPLVWYFTTFTAPSGSCDCSSSRGLLFDATGLGRGHYYLNGIDLGRYWTIEMNDRSGDPTQRYYYLPCDILLCDSEGSNLLVLAEVLGATDISTTGIVQSNMESGTAPPPPEGVDYVSCEM